MSNAGINYVFNIFTEIQFSVTYLVLSFYKLYFVINYLFFHADGVLKEAT